MTRPEKPFERLAVRFTSGDAYCSAWLYVPRGADATPAPVVVMGHGMGATREMGLAPFAERFTAAGLAVLVFTYRNFGDSGGRNRQVVSVKSQLADWESALRYVKTVHQIDASRTAVWGTSFGGGHAITMASRHPELAAAVAQCPFTDGTASAGALGIITTLRVFALVARDHIARLRGHAVTVPIVAPPGHLALMNAPDALPGYNNLLPAEYGWLNYTPARSIPNLIRYRPGRAARKIAIPILFCVSSTDTVAPPQQTLKYARLAPVGDVRIYEAGHFDFYIGDVQQRLADEQADFLIRHLHRVSPEGHGQDRPHRNGSTTTG